MASTEALVPHAASPAKDAPSMQNSEKSYTNRSFWDLPHCMQLRILTLLPPDASDLLRASLVSRHWSALSDETLRATATLDYSVPVWGRRSLLSWQVSLANQLLKCENLRELRVSLSCAMPEPLEPLGIEVLLEGFLRQLSTLPVVKHRLEAFAMDVSGDLQQPTWGLDFLLAAASLKRLSLTNVVIPPRGLRLRRTDRCAVSLSSLALTGVKMVADDLASLVAYLRGLEVLELCGTAVEDLHISSESLRVMLLTSHAVAVLDLKTPKLYSLKVDKGRPNMGFTLCTEGKSKIRRLSIQLEGLGYLRIFGELREVEHVQLSASCWDWTGNIASVLQNSTRLTHLELEATRDSPPDYPDIGSMLARMTTASEPLDLFSFPGRFPGLTTLGIPLGMTEQMVLGRLLPERTPADQLAQFAALESLKVAIWQPSSAHLRYLEDVFDKAPWLSSVEIVIMSKWDRALLHFTLEHCSREACDEYLDDTNENLYKFFKGLSALQKRTSGVDIDWEKMD